MKRIAVDMDEVIADFNSKFIPAFNEQFSESITLNDLHGKTIQQFRPGLIQQIEAMVCSEGYFADIPVMPDSQRVLEDLNARHEVFITSAAMEFPPSFNAKFAWLQHNFPFISPMNIVFCGNKGIIHADYLIDDSPRHFKNFSGEGILFSAPHNVHTEGFRRVNSWAEIEVLFAEL